MVRPVNLNLVDQFQSVDPLDESQVARPPRRVGSHAPHVATDGFAGARIIPPQRKMHDARRHFDLLKRRQRSDALANFLLSITAPDHAGIELLVDALEASGEHEGGGGVLRGRGIQNPTPSGFYGLFL
jgi:hypothetical protein